MPASVALSLVRHFPSDVEWSTCDCFPYSRGMQTCFSSDDPESLPIPCTIVVHDEDRLGSGTIWGFYPQRCHVESALLVSPGMTLSLSLHLPGAPGIRIERSLVTWSRPSEFGMQFVHDPTTGHHERGTL